MLPWKKSWRRWSPARRWNRCRRPSIRGKPRYFSDGPHSGKENGQEKLLNRIFLEELLGRLPAKERRAHLHALFSGHDAGADRRKTGDFAGAGVADGKEDSAADADGKGLTKIQIRRKGAFPGKAEKAPGNQADKGRKKGEAGKGGRKFKNIHWNIGGRCATMRRNTKKGRWKNMDYLTENVAVNLKRIRQSERDESRPGLRADRGQQSMLSQIEKERRTRRLACSGRLRAACGLNFRS